MMVANESTGVLALTQKLLKIGGEIEYIQKDSVNEFQKYRYASERAIKEAIYPKLRENKILFWMEGHADKAHHFKGEKGDTIVIGFTFHFVDTETGAALVGEAVGSGRGGDDKGAYIAWTGALKYTLTTMLGIVTGDDAEADHPVAGTSSQTGGGSSSGVQASAPLPDLNDSEVLTCPDCGESVTFGSIKPMPAKYGDKKGRWTPGRWVYICAGCGLGPKGGKKMMSISLALTTTLKGEEYGTHGDPSPGLSGSD